MGVIKEQRALGACLERTTRRVLKVTSPTPPGSNERGAPSVDDDAHVVFRQPRACTFPCVRIVSVPALDTERVHSLTRSISSSQAPHQMTRALELRRSDARIDLRGDPRGTEERAHLLEVVVLLEHFHRDQQRV